MTLLYVLLIILLVLVIALVVMYVMGRKLQKKQAAQQEQLEVSKKGAVNSQMIFEPDRKSESSYGTPYGNMLAGIQVKNILTITTQK